MKIEEILQAHGSSLRDAAKAIGMKPSTLQATIDRNPTISTLRKIAEAAHCSVAEFFSDELAEMGLMITARPDGRAAAGNESGKDGGCDLPFKDPQATATMQQAVICPHCRHALVFSIATYEQK